MITEEDKRFIDKTFNKLKVVCDEVVKNPTCDNVKNLLNVVSNVKNPEFEYFWEYVLYPIQFHLVRHNTNRYKLHSKILFEFLRCLNEIISKVTIDSINKFVELNILLLQLITEGKNHELAEQVSEEVKYEVINCIYSLYKNVHENLLLEIYNLTKNCILHAGTTYVCIQIIKEETLLKLRILSFKCLLAVVGSDVSEQVISSNNKLKYDIAETVASMFPGIISMCHFITSNSMLHHNLHVYCLRVFSQSVKLVFEPNNIETASEFSFKFNVLLQTDQNQFDILSNGDTKSLRTKEWCEKCLKNLIVYSQSLISLCYNKHWKVRLEIAKASNLVLRRCSSILIPVMVKLFDLLVILSHDEIEVVSKEAKFFLNCICEEKTVRNIKLVQSLKERLFHLLERITYILNSADENILVSQLNLLNGYLGLLDLEQIIKSYVYRENVFNTLMKIVRFDLKNRNTFQKCKMTDLKNVLEISDISEISLRNTKHLTNQIENTLKDIFRTVADNVNIENLTFYLLDLLESSLPNQREILYIINNTILHDKQKFNEGHSDLCKAILDVYLDPKYWCVKNEGFNSNLSSVIQNNLIQVCLLIEGIGNMAVCLMENFKPFLSECLYKVIEVAGSPNSLLNSTALESMKKITYACNYSDISELISDNTECIIYNVSWKLHNLKRNSAVFDVFYVIILNSHKNSLPTLLDLMQTLLESNELLMYYSHFLRVFKIFMGKMRSWFAPTLNNSYCYFTELNDENINFVRDLYEFINEHKKTKDSFSWTSNIPDENINLNEVFDTNDNNVYVTNDENSEKIDPNIEYSNENELRDEDSNDNSSPHLQLVVSVANKVLHLLSDKRVLNKIIILEILADTLLILCDKDDQLLPLVHKMWIPLVNRFKYDNSDPLIMRRCFQLLCIMATVSRDFIRTRTLNDIMPIINNFLLTSAADSRLKDNNSVYRMSQKYKLQFTLLRELGYLAVYICLQERDIHSILVAVTPYLSLQQPLPLQNACITTFNNIKNQHKNVVRIHLMSVWPFEEFLHHPKSTHFCVIRLKKPEKNEEYRKNVAAIQEL